MLENTAPTQDLCRLMEGRTLRRALLKEAEVATQELEKKGIYPAFHVVLVGEDKASKIYVAAKLGAAQKVGIQDILHHLPEHTTQEELNTLLQTLSQSEGVHGILLQLPLPKGLDKAQALSCIAPEKDVDGLTVENIGRLASADKSSLKPCTPLGIMRLLQAYGIDLKGKHAVVLGRSQLVGRPVAEMLSQSNATLTTCHRYTPDITHFTKEADILIVATGNPALVTGDMLKPGAVVVDVGINRLPNGDVVGDCDEESCRKIAGYLSPVPGGVGPMTVATLMTNTIDACYNQHGLPPLIWGQTAAF